MDSEVSEYKALFQSPRLPTLRFVQLLCLALAVLCILLLQLPISPEQKAKDGWLVFIPWVLGVAAIVLPNWGMAWYLRRYILSFAVTDTDCRITVARLLFGRRQLILARTDVHGTRYASGKIEDSGTRFSRRINAVDAPWTWLETARGRYILDGRADDVTAVENWVDNRLGEWQGPITANVIYVMPSSSHRRNRKKSS